MTLAAINSADALCLLDLGALLVDIREEEDRAQVHIPGSLHAPLSVLPRSIGAKGTEAIIFHCSSGLDTLAASDRLQRVARAPAYLLDGGIDRWRQFGHPVVVNRTHVIEVGRQFHLLLGVLLLTGFALGHLVASRFEALTLFLGGALVLAGLTGRCRTTELLRRMPWNRPRQVELELHEPDDEMLLQPRRMA